MNDRLPYSEAIRAFDPMSSPVPFLEESLERVAREAWVHFSDWEPESVERLTESLDYMIRSVTEKDQDYRAAWDTDYVDGGDVPLLGFEAAITGGFYRYFVCRRVPGSTLADALMVHALGAAAQANALAHRLTQPEAPSLADYEEIAGLAMCAERLLGEARLSRQGVLYAEQKASNQGRWAAQGRYRRLQELKEQFVEFYRAGEFPNKAYAARKFFRQLSEEDQKKLSRYTDENDAVRTLRPVLKRNRL